MEKDHIYCTDWSEIKDEEMIDLLKETGNYNKDKNQLIVDFRSELKLPRHKLTNHLLQALKNVSNSGYRYLMIYDGTVKT